MTDRITHQYTITVDISMPNYHDPVLDREADSIIRDELWQTIYEWQTWGLYIEKNGGGTYNKDTATALTVYPVLRKE